MSNVNTQTKAPARESSSPVAELTPLTPQKTAGRAQASPQQASSDGAPPPAQVAGIMTARAHGSGAAGRARQMTSIQRAVGNARVSRMVNPVAAPSPFSIAPSMKQPSGDVPTIQRKCACGGVTGAGGGCDECQAQGQTVQRQATDADAQSSLPSSVTEVLQASGGEPLSKSARGQMEGALGVGLGGARVHTGPQASRAASDISARAFTVGQDIYFGEGQYQPDTPQGQHLLAHELTHTVQQAGGGAALQSNTLISQPDDPLEQEAEAVANHVSSGQTVSLGKGSPPDPGAQPSLARQSTVKAAPGSNGAPQLIPVTSSAGHIQRDILSDLFEERSNRQLIEQAIETEEVFWVKTISDFSEASETERMQLVDILLDQSWVGPSDEAALEYIWESFGDDVLEVAKRNFGRWTSCVDRGAELDDLEAIEDIQDSFRWDTTLAAINFIEINEQYVHAELDALGIGSAEGPSTPDELRQQRENLDELREIATEVLHGREAQAQLRQLKVGKVTETEHDGFARMTYSYPVYFDPADPPGRNVYDTEDSISWASVKEQWDKVTAVINGFANTYPVIYALLGNEDTADEALAQVAVDGPQGALTLIQGTMNGVLAKMAESREMIRSEDLDDRDLKPVHQQLFTGLRPPGWSHFPWEEPIYKWAAEDLLSDWESQQFWLQLGLATLAAAAFIVAEIATFGSATFFIAAGVGAGATAVTVGRSWENYGDLATAADATINDELALVSQGQADAALTTALVDSVFAFLDVAGPALKVVRGLRGAGKAVEEVAEESIETTAREASQQVLERGAVETAEELGEGVARIAPEQAANWSEVSQLIGRPVNEVTLPAGYRTYQRGGKTFIRRAEANDQLFARIGVDENGLITAGRPASRRVSRPGALARALGERPPRHQAHHVVPDEIVRDHPLFDAARRRGQPPYAVDDASNGVYLAEGEQFRVVGVSDDLPLHSGSHREYNELARTEADQMSNALIRDYGSLGQVPPEVLSNAAHEVQERMWTHLQSWMDTHGRKL